MQSLEGAAFDERGCLLAQLRNMFFFAAQHRHLECLSNASAGAPSAAACTGWCANPSYARFPCSTELCRALVHHKPRAHRGNLGSALVVACCSWRTTTTANFCYGGFRCNRRHVRMLMRSCWCVSGAVTFDRRRHPSPRLLTRAPCTSSAVEADDYSWQRNNPTQFLTAGGRAVRESGVPCIAFIHHWL